MSTMEPMLAIYRADQVVVGALVRAGTKGLQLVAVGIASDGGNDHSRLEQLKAHLQWDGSVTNITLVLESPDSALASFPLDDSTTEHIVREQAELEIVQQFLSSPSEGYCVELYRTCPDVEGRTMACGVFVLDAQRSIADTVRDVFGVHPVVRTAALGSVAAYVYNYPERRVQQMGIVTLGARSVDVVVLRNGTIGWWGWHYPMAGSPSVMVQRMVREAVLHCGELTMLSIAGSGAHRSVVDQIALAFEERFEEPITVLDGFRMLECGMDRELCSAVAPLGHVFAPAIGGALQQFYLEPTWRFEVPTAAESQFVE